MSAGPSSSGAVLGLGYTSPIMLLHQILEPSSRSASGLSSLPSFRRRPPPRVASEEPSRLHALPDFLKTNRRRRLPAAFAGFSPSPRLPKLGSLLAGPWWDVRAVTRCSRHGSLGAPRALTVHLESALPPCVSPPVLRCSVRIARL